MNEMHEGTSKHVLPFLTCTSWRRLVAWASQARTQSRNCDQKVDVQSCSRGYRRRRRRGPWRDCEAFRGKQSGSHVRVPDHEQPIGAFARSVGFTHTSEPLLPMIRMVPRDASSAADAYLTPILSDYLDGLFQGFDDELHNATVVE